MPPLSFAVVFEWQKDGIPENVQARVQEGVTDGFVEVFRHRKYLMGNTVKGAGCSWRN